MTKNFAVTIGINNYDPNNFRQLDYAKRDAELMRDFFEQEAQFDRVLFFADDSPDLQLPNGLSTSTIPTLGNLITFLSVQFERPFLNSVDNCWLFFAGHGIRHNGRDYLMPLESNSVDVSKSGIEVNYVRDRLSRCGADNVILVLDACRSEGGRNATGIGRDFQKGVVTIYSCSPEEQSWESDDLQQGVFTYALLEGLRRKGPDNCATVERLSQYLRDRVPQLCREKGKRLQVPSVNIEPLEKQHFVLIPQCLGPIDLALDILKMKNDIYRLAFCDKNLDLAEKIWKRVSVLTGGKDEEVHEMLRGITRDRLQNFENLKQRLGAAQQELERYRSQLQTTENEHRSTLAEYQAQAGELTRQLTEEQGRTELLRSQLQTIENEHRSTLAEYQAQVGELTRQLTEEQGRTELLQSQLQEIEKNPQVISAEQSKGQPFSFEVVSVNRRGEIINRETKEVYGVTELLPDGATLELVYIPKGEFLMGSPDGEGLDHEKPQRLVTIHEFWMGKYPVTQAQWRVIAALPPVNQELKPDPACFKGNQRPVECISQPDAVEFCARLSRLTGQIYRLPSEVEWEYACRGGTTTPFYFGETITTDLANFKGTESYGDAAKGIHRKETVDVGGFPPNPFGLYDLHGNVWERCADRWHDSYQGAPNDSSPWMDSNSSYYVVRGGSWLNNPRYCRSAFRNNDVIDSFNNVGFRVVCCAPRTLL